ncbi:MAG: Primosomal protein N' [Firmicutes bacterium]|nr:Primosomal protein N' [Bacillota bacterium]
MLMRSYAKVVVGVPVEKAFYYALPEEMTGEVIPGVRVVVPFSGRKLTGYVVGLSREKPDVSLREIAEIVDSSPIFDGEMLKLTRWVSDYYCCPWGEALHAAFPPGVRMKKKKSFSPEELSSPPAESLSSSVTLLHHANRGGGKIEFYLQAIKQALKQGRQALVLFPEVSHFQNILNLLRFQFREKIAILHGRLLPWERYHEWLRMRSGAARVVIGTRSAVFAPLVNLGLIIVDEESNPLYKEKRTPAYHAREVALERARLWKVPLILGAQAPSLESYFQAERGKYKLMVLSPAGEKKELPEIEIADLRCEFSSRRVRWALSLELRQEIEACLRRGEQTVLFISRRGAGTQKLIDEVGRLFPNARLGKAGTAYEEGTRAQRHKGTKYEETISLFRRGKIDILIGTQAVLKELGGERLSLVGIISADTILNIGNFRAAEKMFQLLTQVSNSLLGKQNGKVIIQTYNPAHYSILNVGDYPQFYREEVEFRRQLNYPPFTSLINIMIKDEEAFRRLIAILEANRDEGVEILPSKAGMRGQQIIIKGENLAGMRRVIRGELSSSRWNKAGVKVDVDPVEQ